MDNHIVFQKLIYVTDYGEFEIPSDVPFRALRNDGWFDRRRTITGPLKAYFTAMGERIRDNNPIQTWAEFNA